MLAALTLVALLCLLEYIFWLSPLKARLMRWMEAVGDWYYLAPFHYLLRLAVLGAVILLMRPNLWPVFGGGGIGWVGSILGGAVLAWGNWVEVGLQSGKLTPQMVRKRAEGWARADGWRFWAQSAYIAVYPGFVEELLFRWFVPAALWPVLGWWGLLVAPVLNMLWHLPVWYSHVSRQVRPGAALLNMALPVAVYAVALTFVAMMTQNLIGPVLAHAFGDWLGGVHRWAGKRAA